MNIMSSKFNRPKAASEDLTFSQFNNSKFNPPAANLPITSNPHRRGVPGAGWADDMEEPGQNQIPQNPPVQTYDQAVQGETQSTSEEPGFYESRLVDSITQPGGAR